MNAFALTSWPCSPPGFTARACERWCTDAPPGSLAAFLEEENFDYEATSNALWEEELVKMQRLPVGQESGRGLGLLYRDSRSVAGGGKRTRLKAIWPRSQFTAPFPSCCAP